MTWQELSQHKLVVYSTTWCPDCRRLKMVLDAAGVSYREIDIDKDPKAADHLRAKTNRTAIPFVEIDDGPMVRGWHDEASGHWNEAIFFAEVSSALA